MANGRWLQHIAFLTKLQNNRTKLLYFLLCLVSLTKEISGSLVMQSKLIVFRSSLILWSDYPLQEDPCQKCIPPSWVWIYWPFGRIDARSNSGLWLWLWLWFHRGASQSIAERHCTLETKSVEIFGFSIICAIPRTWCGPDHIPTALPPKEEPSLHWKRLGLWYNYC